MTGNRFKKMAEIADKQQKEKSLEVEVLTKVAQIASSTLELREILDTISHVVADTINKDLCSICLFKSEKQVVCIEAAKGVSKEHVNIFCIKNCRNLLHRALD